MLWSKRERSSWCSVYLMREAIGGHQISSRGQRRHIQSALITSNQPSSHPISPHHIQSASLTLPSTDPQKSQAARRDAPPYLIRERRAPG